MSDTPPTPEGWTRHERPPSLFRRFTFESYGETHTFLDRLGSLSEETGYYPDISFGTGYANVTINARDESALSTEDQDFARRVNAFVPSGAASG